MRSASNKAQGLDYKKAFFEVSGPPFTFRNL